MSKLAYHIEHYKAANIGALAGHNSEHRTDYATHGNPDIDPARSADNMVLLAPDNGLYLAAKSRINHGCTGRVTAASNWLTETITYPPDTLRDPEEIRKYFSDVLAWHQDKFGAANVLSAVVHMDETTPHMHLDLVPLTQDGRLTSKEIFTRAALQQQHTDLARFLSEKGWDIQRGDIAPKGQKRKTKTVKEYKAAAEAEKAVIAAELNAAKAELKALSAPSAIDSFPVGRTISGQVKIDPEAFESLKREVKVARLAADQTRRAEARAAALQEEVKQLHQTVTDLRQRPTRFELDRIKVQHGKEVNDLTKQLDAVMQQLAVAVKYIVLKLVDFWDRLVAPIHAEIPSSWGFRQAMHDAHKPEQAEAIRAALPEITDLEHGVGGAQAALAAILDAKGIEGREKYSILEYNRKFYDPKPDREATHRGSRSNHGVER